MTGPVATYRLQLEPGFDLHQARTRVPYLARLGVSHLYLSPILEARRGSTHGYDVTDPSRVREELGGAEAFTALGDEAAAHGLGILLDIVPNHMAASEEAPAWRDVLRRGAASPFARWFDLSWHTGPGPFPIPLPVLGRPQEEALAEGELTVAVEEGSDVRLAYFERRFPCSPESLAWLAEWAGAPPAAAARELAALPPHERTAPLRDLLALQHYELRFWRGCAGVVGYRRFFDIDDLVGLRVEDPAVFEATHAGLARCMAHPAVAGVRVDHVDGLLDPTAYLRRLRALLDRHRPGSWLLVEKILAADERLPPRWPVDGTTGYEFLVNVNGLHVPEAGGRALLALHHRLTGLTTEHAQLALARKRQVLEAIFAGELELLARELTALRDGDGAAVDGALRSALAETSLRMEVYRTYVRGPEVAREDRRRIQTALAAATVAPVEDAGHGEEAYAAALMFLRSVLLLDGARLKDRFPAALAFVRRWQQFTGPLMAKGFEDTALYRHSALAAANDVGAEPDRPWSEPREVHAFLASRAAMPATLNTTSTHDTKRSEDVRARLDVLAELPEAWSAAVAGWLGPDAPPHPPDRRAERLDDTVYLLYQTLVGTWPLDGAVDDRWIERLRTYAVKAAREAKARTSWRDPDPSYEEALQDMVERFLRAPEHAAARAECRALAERTAAPGALVSMAQLLVKLTAPGVPDLYRGSELWRYDLVDPDNRRPVDFALREGLLAQVAALAAAPAPAPLRALVERWHDGALKLFVTHAGLAFRARHRDAYARGTYTPLEPSGAGAEHLFAFQRGGPSGPVTLAARLLAPEVGGAPAVPAELWEGASLPLAPGAPAGWRNALTGEGASAAAGRLPLQPLLRVLPLALLEPAEPVGR